jgi:hypothetical protein
MVMNMNKFTFILFDINLMIEYLIGNISMQACTFRINKWKANK